MPSYSIIGLPRFAIFRHTARRAHKRDWILRMLEVSHSRSENRLSKSARGAASLFCSWRTSLMRGTVAAESDGRMMAKLLFSNVGSQKGGFRFDRVID
jgi:hypothetical protein